MLLGHRRSSTCPAAEDCKGFFLLRAETPFYSTSYGALYALRSTLRMYLIHPVGSAHNYTNHIAARNTNRVTLFTQHLEFAALSDTTVVRPVATVHVHQSKTSIISTTTPACKHSVCLGSLLLYKVQGFNVSMHAMLEYIYGTGWHHLGDACTLPS